MSERIFIKSAALGQNINDVQVQVTAETDIRYSGIVQKERLHPRLIIRKFRKTNLTPSSLDESKPIIEFNNFILTEANEEVEEKYQITQTFGPDFIFMYGPRPRIFTYAGVLFNTADKPWTTEWQSAWDRSVPTQASFPTSPGNSNDTQQGILSGTNVVINGGIARLEYDGSYGFRKANGTIDPSGAGLLISPNDKDPGHVLSVREGFIIKFAVKKSGDRPNACSFQLAMLVTNRLDF